MFLTAISWDGKQHSAVIAPTFLFKNKKKKKKHKKKKKKKKKTSVVSK